MKFSQRVGKTPTEKLVQRESIDEDLMNSLWSALTLVYFDDVSFQRHHHNESRYCNLAQFLKMLWIHYFKKPVDEIPYKFSDSLMLLRKHFFSSAWYVQFDFLEACAHSGDEDQKAALIEFCEFYLKRENSAYRFVSGELTEITSEVEIEAVESATTSSGRYTGVKAHLTTALQLLKDRENPDYRNSIKESISAVESLAKILSGDSKATLGQALKILEKKGDLHSALKSAFSSLYGYTNDSDGIRHALLEESTLTKADAKFMLVSCSAFVNYLIELSGE